MSSYDDDVKPGTWVLLILGVIVVIGLSAWGIRACNAAQDATLGRAEENIKTQNYEQSEAYRQGLRRDFDELLLSYNRSKDPDERATIISVMRHRAQGAPPDLIPPEVKTLLAQQTGGDR